MRSDGVTVLKGKSTVSAQKGLITVQGHTDSVGSSSYNLALSLRRAEAVVACLVAHGHIAKSRLYATGSCESDPVAPNATAANRRVVITGTH